MASREELLQSIRPDMRLNKAFFMRVYKALHRNAFYADLRAKGYIDPPYCGTYCFKDIRWKSEMESAENTPESEFTQIDCTNEIIPFD